MMDKMKDKLPGKATMEKKKPMAGIEIEIEGDEEGRDMESAEEEGMEESDEEVAVGDLAKFSDEELQAELDKRQQASGGSSIQALPPAPEEEEEVVVPKKKAMKA